MLLTVPSNLQTAANQASSRPIWLVEIGGSPVVRLCSGDDFNWNTYLWSGRHLLVQKLSYTETFSITGDLVIGDVDGYFGAFALTGTGLAGRSLKIWRGDRGSPSDLLQVVNGSCGRMRGSPKRKEVVVSFSSEEAAWLPRRTIGPEVGATKYLPAGTPLQIGTDKYIIKR